MSLGYSVAVCAVPFIDLLEEQVETLASAMLDEESDEASRAAALGAVRRRLLAGVDSVVRSLPGAVRAEQALVRAVAYALVGLVDERMLHHPAAATRAWRELLLETELYGSALAGQRIVSTARAAAQRAATPGGDDLGTRSSGGAEDSAVLAPLYLALLRSGFEGSLRGDAVALTALMSSLEHAIGADEVTRPVIDTPGAAARVHRFALSSGDLAVCAMALWLLGSAMVWYAFSAPSLDTGAALSERLREGLSVGDAQDESIHGVGPTPGSASRDDASQRVLELPPLGEP